MKRVNTEQVGMRFQNNPVEFMYVMGRFQLGRGPGEKEMQDDAVRNDVAHSR